MAIELVGRASEIAVVKSLLAGVADGGGSLLVLGDPGIGKSALVEAASVRAADSGMRVLACAGVPSEAHFSFAGLHQLLRPVLAGADSLPRGQRDALLTALGVAEGPAPAMLMVGLAALELLTGLAERTPLLVVAEDAHCLDLSTCEVLAFVSRRLGAVVAVESEDHDHQGSGPGGSWPGHLPTTADPDPGAGVLAPPASRWTRSGWPSLWSPSSPPLRAPSPCSGWPCRHANGFPWSLPG